MSYLRNKDNFEEWFAEIGETINRTAGSEHVPVTYDEFLDQKAAEEAAALEDEKAAHEAMMQRVFGERALIVGETAVQSIKHPDIEDTIIQILKEATVTNLQPQAG